MNSVRSAISILISASCVIGTAGIIERGVSTWNDATTVPTHVSKYASITAASFPGSRFVNGMVSKSVLHDSVTMKTMTSDSVSVLPSECDSTIPSTVVYDRSGIGDGYTITVMAFGAGQATKQYESYQSSCTSIGDDAVKSDGLRYSSWSDGYLVVAGDAMVEVKVDDRSRMTAVLDSVMKRMRSLLASTSCVSISESAGDSTRSFYYDRKSYTGLTKVKQVETTTRSAQLSSPQSLINNSGSMSEVFSSPTTRDAPESPLPSSMKGSLPTEPSLPQLPSSPSSVMTTALIEYQVDDEDGPGCGWTWSGQKSPSIASDALRRAYEKTRTSQLTQLSNSVLAYNTLSKSWSLSAMWSMRFITTWSSYVKSVNSIVASWNALDKARDDFKPTWTKYIQSLYTWEKGRLAYDDEKSDYDSTVSTCVDKKESDWESKQTDTSAKVTDAQKAEWKTECTSENTMPDDLKASYATEPSAPTVPSTMTIPSSWTTKAEIISQADSDYAKEKKAKDKTDSSTSTSKGTSTNKDDASTNKNDTSGSGDSSTSGSTDGANGGTDDSGSSNGSSTDGSSSSDSSANSDSGSSSGATEK